MAMSMEKSAQTNHENAGARAEFKSCWLSCKEAVGKCTLKLRNSSRNLDLLSFVVGLGQNLLGRTVLTT